MIEGKLWNREGHDDHEDEEQESSGSGFGAVSVNNGRRRTRSDEAAAQRDAVHVANARDGADPRTLEQCDLLADGLGRGRAQ